MKRNLCLLLFCMVICMSFAQPYNLTWTKRTDLTGLPSEISVYSTTSTLNGRAFSAWYAIADMTTGNIEFRALLSATHQTPSQFVSNYGSNAYICTNGGFFDTSTTTGASYSLVLDRGSVAASNIGSVTRSNQTYYLTRGVLGVDQNQNGTCGWNYSLNGVPWIYPIPSQNVDGNTPQPQPSSSFPAGGQQWDAYSAVGGGPLLVKDGKSLIDYSTNYELLQSDVYGNGVLDPRTAVGYTANGKMILFVCDGRETGIAQGATLDELAELMIELGCTNALNLDGGGSSAMIASNICLNNPSDGSQRPVSAAVMFTKKGASSVTPNFTQLWNFTQASGVLPSPDWTFASTNARDIAADNRYVYVPVRCGTQGDGVRVIDQNTGQLMQVLSMNGVSGGTFAICGISISTDGKILVSNMTTSPSASPFKIYMYDSSNLNADPKLLLSFAGTSGTGTLTARMGDNFTYEGSTMNGTIRVASNGVAGKYFVWTVQNGAVVNVEPTVVNLLNADGSGYTTPLGGYPRVYPAGNDSVWIKGAGYRPSLFVQNKYVGTVGSALQNNFGNTALPFIFQGKRYLASVDYAGTVSGYGDNAQGVLIDVTNNTNGVSICRTPTNFGTTGNINQTDGVAVNVSQNGFKIFFLSASEGTSAYSVGEDVSTGNMNPIIKKSSLVYSNPVHEIAYFTETVQQATLYSLSGEVIKRITNNNQISVTGLSGLYLLKIVDKKGEIFNNKLVVK